jgi:predicted metal-dependent hydrolase
MVNPNRPQPTCRRISGKKNEAWLFGVDLYNFGYWWESHEQWEALWKLDRNSEQEKLFYRAVIQLAAANIKRFLDRIEGAKSLAGQALEKLRKIEASPYMGVDISLLIGATEQFHITENSSHIPRLSLMEKE